MLYLTFNFLPSGDASEPPRSMSQTVDLSALKIDERVRRSNGRNWWGWATLLVVLAVVLTGAGLYLFGPPEVEVAVARAAEPGPAALLNASGYVTPRRRATIAAKVTGQVAEIFAEEGMSVEAGQILARLDDADARARLRSAEADRDATAATLADLRVNLANAERDQRRMDALWKEGAISEQMVDQARTLPESYRARIASAEEQVRAAETRIRVAQEDLENTVIRAPFGGIVVSKDAQRGEMVSPISAGGGFTRTGIATLVDMTSLEIEVDVNESYIARVRPGQPAQTVLDAYPDWKIPCRVRTVIPTADRQKATVKVRLTFDRLDPRILPDMGVKVSFFAETKRETTAPIVLIPRGAVREDAGKKFVFLLRDGRAERRPVRLGEARAGEQEILSGVAAGDSVISKGPDGLQDGERVTVGRGR